MIVTFYSFKGGVGRSMALANIGRWFQLRGLDVVLVDWDLEAPGLESYFIADAAPRAAARGRLGLLDLITTYKDVYPGLPVDAAGAPPDNEAFGRLLDEALPPLDTLLLTLPAPRDAGPQPATGRLRLLTAGCRSEARFAGYAETVQSFDWAKFYTDYRGAAYFDWLRRQLLQASGAEIVLIDSRTGVAEMSGICTRQLADVVLVPCAPNDQNLEGVAMMADSFVRPDVLQARGTRRLELVMVPARIDVSEGRPIDLFEAQFKARLDRFTPEIFHRFGTRFTRLRIPYISAYAFAERLAVGEAEGVKSLQEAYAEIGTHLALLAPGQSAVRRQCKFDLQRAFGMPSVSVGSLDAEGALAEADLRARLEEAGLFALALPAGAPDAWFVRTGPPGTAPALHGSIVLCLGRESLQDGRIRPLWRLARENGICLHFVAATPSTQATGEAAWPRWPRDARLWDAQQQWGDMLVQLGRPCQATRVPFLAPPPGARLIGRESELAGLQQLLIAAKHSPGTVAVTGMAGLGKTSIARAVCNEDAVLDHFHDGILWVSFGAETDTAAALNKLVRALDSSDAAAELDLDEAQRRLTLLLERRRCLVVYDDLIDVQRMERLPRGGPECQVLITTRSRLVAEAPGIGLVLQLEPLSASASLSLLAADLVIEPGRMSELSVLAQRLGGSPMALAVANRTLRARSRGAPVVAEAVVGVLRDIDQYALDAIDAASGTPGSGSVWSALNASLEMLGEEDRARLPMLARLPAESPVMTSLVASTVQCSVEEARALLERLARAYLVDFDARADLLRIPPLVHQFLRTMEIRQRRVETTRVIDAGPADRRGIYISYRRADSAAQTGRLHDRLALRFGADRVFMDTDSIRLGDSFDEVIASNLARAGVLIVVIGPRWIEPLDSSGSRRLDDRNDFIRLEIGMALLRQVRIVPVLVGGAAMPPRDELPPELAGLTQRQALALGDSSFESDVDRLVIALQRLLDKDVPVAQPRPETPAVAIDAPASPLEPVAAPLPHGPAWWRRGPGLALLIGALALVVALISFNRGSSNPKPDPIGTQALPGAAEFSKAEDFYFGRNGPRDNAAALKLYQQAAELGNASAQNSLGRMYELGEGTARNLQQALQWYGKAAEQGHPDAKAALARLLPAASSAASG